MKNILKLIPLYSLAVCTYILLVTAFSDFENDMFYTITECVLLALWALNFVYSVLLAIFMKNGKKSFLITVFVAKILLVPAFIMLFIMGFILIMGIFIAPLFAVAGVFSVWFFIIASYCLMLSTAAYSVGGMIKFYKNNKSPFIFLLTAVCCVCQFIFVADVISLLVYILLAKQRKPLPQNISDI